MALSNLATLVETGQLRLGSATMVYGAIAAAAVAALGLLVGTRGMKRSA